MLQEMVQIVDRIFLGGTSRFHYIWVIPDERLEEKLLAEFVDIMMEHRIEDR